MLVKIILTFYGFMTIITQDREPSKVTASKQITGTLITAIHPKQLASKRSFA
jgi:hypothetical protein